MKNAQTALCYHGRRSADELVVALNAANAAAARVHKELSLLHLDRFVAIVTSAADGIGEPR